ncbi:hypothetical protein LOD99_507 [Oopsacas minuta]|uniref:Uncharacterized protein n=1 Tax=Oopsacas minuta TaxID=111878 RepID=A0AAV7K9G0_9METZ|nr:hypothetical protein LOD99_507 [Oopsacas minuta]
MVVGQLINGNIYIEWLYPSTERVNLTIIVRIGNFINGENVLSDYKSTEQIASEIGYIPVNLPDDYEYDYVYFQICTEIIGKISKLSDHGIEELSDKCTRSQIVLADRDNKIEMKILKTRTLEDRVEFEFNSEISIEADKSTNLQCIATDLNNQKDKRKQFSIQYLKTYIGRSGSSLITTKALSKNSTYKCILQVNSPNYYQLYSSEIISFSITKKGKNKITNPGQVILGNKKRVRKTATTKLDPAVIKRLKANKATGRGRGQKHLPKNVNPRMYNIRTVEQISQETKNKVKARLSAYYIEKPTEESQNQKKYSINQQRNC